MSRQQAEAFYALARTTREATSVAAPDKDAAIAKAMEEFRIEPARRFRLIVVPVE